MIDYSKNTKQGQFLVEVMKAVNGYSPNRFFAYGGGIRGGKTFSILGILALFASRLFPRSRWHIIRENMTVIKSTTVPSMEKILPPNHPRWRYKRSAAEYHIEFNNGSKIFFNGENFIQDKELLAFQGLETNGIFLEQAEELSERMLQRAIERTGSWYIPQMPPGFVFMTFNPTDRWCKKRIYDPYKDGTLQSPWFFMEALASDNPFVTDDQWRNWEEMDEIDYRRYIGGDWDSQRKGGEFYHKFSRTRHTGLVDFNPELPVHLTFDQNVVPYVTLLAWQMDYNADGILYLKQFDEFCLANPNNTTEAVCQAFLDAYGNRIKSICYLYGDASGNRRDTRSKQTDYDIAKRVLARFVTNNSDRTCWSNPNVVKRGQFINNILDQKYPIRILIDSDKCPNTIADFDKVVQDANGGKLKKRVTDPWTGVSYEELGHGSDATDYFVVTALDAEWQRFLNI